MKRGWKEVSFVLLLLILVIIVLFDASALDFRIETYRGSELEFKEYKAPEDVKVVEIKSSRGNPDKKGQYYFSKGRLVAGLERRLDLFDVAKGEWFYRDGEVLFAVFDFEKGGVFDVTGLSSSIGFSKPTRVIYDPGRGILAIGITGKQIVFKIYPESIKKGSQIIVSADIDDAGKIVVMPVEKNGNLVYLGLYDDGKHFDVKRNDGIYGRVLVTEKYGKIIGDVLVLG